MRSGYYVYAEILKIMQSDFALTHSIGFETLLPICSARTNRQFFHLSPFEMEAFIVHLVAVSKLHKTVRLRS
jgi:hypothetical protein